MKIIPLLFMLFFGGIALRIFADEGYPGSQAYNKTQLSHESVNAATGSFDYSYQLISTKGRLTDFQLHLSYRFNKQGVVGIKNPLGQQTEFTYISFAGRNLLRTIQTPKGLMTQINYDTISYNSGGDTKHMPVVNMVSKMDLATNIKIEETHISTHRTIISPATQCIAYRITVTV